MPTREELAEMLVSEDLETEVISMSGALVIDSDDIQNFTDDLNKLFEKYAYLDQFEIEI